jgi:hypothetical protein
VHARYPEVPTGFDGVVKRAMAKNRDERYESGAAMVAAAVGALEGRVETTRILRRPPRPRGPWLAARLGAGGALATVLVTALLLLMHHPASGGGSNHRAAVDSPVSSGSPAVSLTPSAAAPPAVTADQLTTVAASLYPSARSGIGNFTTCADGGFDACPLTPRLRNYLKGVRSSVSLLGGGQNPAWATRTITVSQMGTGGVAHVVLEDSPRPAEHKDLLIAQVAGEVLVDDIYCTGQDPTVTSIYGPNWANTYSTC